MKKFIEKHLTQIQIGTLALILIVAGGTGYFIYSLFSRIDSVKNDVALLSEELNGKIENLQGSVDGIIKTSEGLSQNLQAQQSQSTSLGQTLSGLAGTVNTLEKLSKTDRELLQKYSKVYFLNENYVPIQLSDIATKYLKNKNADLKFHSVVMPFLTKMLDAVDASGATTQVVSAYRSFGTQSALKKSYLVSYGAGANTFSADQGYSEHQLGTTVDLTSADTSGLEVSFDQTSAYAWLTNNAYKYGFILSYPKNNAYYQYEPWHWRFVGIALATKLHSENKHFYDLNQRDIDSYLVSIFDQN